MSYDWHHADFTNVAHVSGDMAATERKVHGSMSPPPLKLQQYIQAYVGGDAAATELKIDGKSTALFGVTAYLLWASVYMVKQVREFKLGFSLQLAGVAVDLGAQIDLAVKTVVCPPKNSCWL